MISCELKSQLFQSALGHRSRLSLLYASPTGFASAVSFKLKWPRELHPLTCLTNR